MNSKACWFVFCLCLATIHSAPTRVSRTCHSDYIEPVIQPIVQPIVQPVFTPSIDYACPPQIGHLGHYGQNSVVATEVLQGPGAGVFTTGISQNFGGPSYGGQIIGGPGAVEIFGPPRIVVVEKNPPPVVKVQPQVLVLEQESPAPIVIADQAPTRIEHVSRPYVVENFNTQYIVDHYQSAKVDNFHSTPVVVDHYLPASISETQTGNAVVQTADCGPIGQGTLLNGAGLVGNEIVLNSGIAGGSFVESVVVPEYQTGTLGGALIVDSVPGVPCTSGNPCISGVPCAGIPCASGVPCAGIPCASGVPC